MADATAPWRLYDVTVDGFGTSTLSARSRGAALYSRFLDFTDAYDCTFRDFLRIAKVAVGGRPMIDPYEYIRGYYGVDIRHGTRVTITGEGCDLEGKAGTVVHPGRDSTAHAHVVIDEYDHAIIVHPKSLVLA